MPSQPPASLTPATVYRLLRDHAWLWIAPAVAGLLLTAVATLVTPRKWKATQGMIVRSEAAGYAGQRLGKFTDLSEMRTVQETVLELARSRSVLAAALAEVGPPPSLFGNSSFPSAEDVEDLREQLRITPPGGAVFGETEVFYLTVLDAKQQRAVQLVDAVAKHLETRMQELKNSQAGSMVQELENAAAAARNELQRHTDRLAKMEAEVGANLADLRNLVSPLGGQGVLAQKILSIENNLRETETVRRRNSELLATLRLAQTDPTRLLATPSALLVSQPSLQRLKDGLVDAQMQAASLRSTRSDVHPFVIAATVSEQQHRAELHNEIPIAMAGVELELSLSQQREAALRKELAETRAQLNQLAGRRAEYSMLIAAVENQTRLVDAAEGQLADARAHSAGAKSASVLARVDAVEAGIRPVGPGRTTVSLAGGLGGLILGLGLVFVCYAPRNPAIIEPPTAAQPHRNTDIAPTPGTWTEQFPAATVATATPANIWSEVRVDSTGQAV
ncbi:MAG: hypothetical protein AAGF31_00970 [Planctomycetota bacterium]